MTPTKRKRLHAKNKPLPGDLVILKQGHPILRRPGSYGVRMRWIKDRDEVALLLAVCDPRNPTFLDWSLVFTLQTNTLGWVTTESLQPCP